MSATRRKPPTWSEKAAIAAWRSYLVAVIAALAVTLDSVASSVGQLAAAVVSPIIAVTLFLLYFDRRRRGWSFAGAAALGILEIILRLIVNAAPQLEVGGGLPLWVTATYVTLGILLVATSLRAFLSLRPASPPGSRPAPRIGRASPA